MPKSSIKSRFAISIFINTLKGLLSFITVLVLARALGPGLYGDFAFLMGSFVAFKALLSLGTSNAFYTFMSQNPRGGKFLAAYGGWQLIQFFLMILFIGFFSPDELIKNIWVDQKRELILLSYVVVFMQMQAWQTMIHIGESTRLTYRVQIMNLVIATIHLLIVFGLWIGDLLSLKILFSIIICEYVFALLVALKLFKVFSLPIEPFNGRKVFQEYLIYCSPLIIYSMVGFAHEFADRWLLQYFGGSKEQGLFEVSYRFCTISLLVATSILNVFWKEFAEAKENEDLRQMQKLYTRVSRFLFAFGAIISGFLIPWSYEIVRIFLGENYMNGAPVLAIMLVFSIYAAMGQINGTLMYAANRTKEQLFIGAVFMAVGVPVSYFLQAPQDAMIPGLNLGALGMAIKRVLLNLILVNIVAWWINRSYGWKFDWIYQLINLAGTLLLGWIAQMVAVALISPVSTGLFFSIGTAFLIYSVMVGYMYWSFPRLAGFTREGFLQHLKNPLGNSKTG